MNLRPVPILLLAALALTAHARWAAPEEIPTARVIANLDATLKAHPNNHDARLTLARVHSLAYASHSTTTAVYSGNELPSWQTVKNAAEAIPTDAEMKHLRKSLVNYNLVTHQNPDLGLAWLGAGFMLEEASRWAHRSNPIMFAGKKLSTKADFKNAALMAYRRCFEIGLETDFTDNHAMHGIESQWLTRESGESIMRLIHDEQIGGYETGERAKIEDAIQRSKDRPTAITPILFPVDRSRPLSDLINPLAKTKFDLAGDQAGQTWPWITPQAAWLVWDPEATGRITSGRQLFGSVTWWMMFKDGYAALATLDDDRDGWLKGKELKGISAWHDLNGNAKSDRGEVRPLTDWKVAAIRTTYDRGNQTALTSDAGIVLKDGTLLPTYDWIPQGTNPR